jgi:twinkle protein
MLKAGRVEEMLNAMWRAQPYRPEGIVELSTLKDKVLAGVKQGIDWCPRTHCNDVRSRTGRGLRFGAGTGVGKTDLLMQQVEFDINVLGINVGVFFFEQNPERLRCASSGRWVASRSTSPTQAGHSRSSRRVGQVRSAKGKVFAYDSFGVNDWDVVKERIRFLYHSEGVRTSTSIT